MGAIELLVGKMCETEKIGTMKSAIEKLLMIKVWINYAGILQTRIANGIFQ